MIDNNLDDELRITVIATGLSGNTVRRPRESAWSSPQIERGSLLEKEIPAVTRIDDINEHVSRELSRDIFNPKWQQRSAAPVNRTNPVQPEKRPDAPRPASRPEINAGWEDVERTLQDVKAGNGNGHEDNDFDIPACRRKRWNLL